MGGFLDKDKELRSHVLSLLEGGNAHIKLQDAVKGFPIGKINAKAQNVPYSPWELIEHMRITQYDILDFIRNPKYRYMEWPKDYWPAKGKKADSAAWRKSISAFNRDAAELKKILKDPKTDLYAKIPHGTGQTVLREMLLVADHNAYHIGELLVVRRGIGAWKD